MRGDCEGEQEIELSLGAFRELKKALLATGLQCHVVGDDLLLFEGMTVRPCGGLSIFRPSADAEEGIVA